MIRRLPLLVLVGVLAALLFRSYVMEGIYIATASMTPSMPVGSQLFLEKITLLFRDPARGDIIVFSSPVKEDHDLVKRVIALPGETIEIRDKLVYIDGERLQEPYVMHTRAGERLEDDNVGPLTVPAGMVFVMGDNRDESDDSRLWKDPVTGQNIFFVSKKRIKGKALWLFD